MAVNVLIDICRASYIWLHFKSHVFQWTMLIFLSLPTEVCFVDIQRMWSWTNEYFTVTMSTTMVRQKKLWRQCERLRYSTDVRGVQCQHSPILIPLFLSLLTDSRESRWGTYLTSWLSHLSCYFADHCQLCWALSLTKWGCLLLCFMEWESTSIIYCIFYTIIPCIRINWDGETYAYAKNPDNWNFLWKWATLVFRSSVVVFCSMGWFVSPCSRPHGPSGREDVYLYSFMISALDGVDGERHAPAAFTPGKHPVPIVQEAFTVWICI